MSERVLNPAMVVTLVRLVMTPLLMWLILHSHATDWRWWATVIFLLATLTDWVDGYLARSRGEVTVLGTFLDSLVDKLLITGALVCLVQTHEVSAWATMVIVTREFAVTGLRMVAINERLVIPANRLGKWKFTAQAAAIGLLLAPETPGWLDQGMLWVALVLTIISGAYYFVVTKQRLFPSKPPA
ncbi:MAG: CDP-diacylglycerol--glycerol-3-phosphate 3-phosphatidyltransferase [Thermoleophilia bacterium]